MVKPRFSWVPWILALLYGVPATIIALFGNEWKLLPLYFVTLPVSMVFERFGDMIRDHFFGARPSSGEYLLLDHIVSAIYVVGGMLWFAALGVLLRHLLRWTFPREDAQDI